MSAVLRHVTKYRPEWVVDFQAEEGRQTVGNGIVRTTFKFGDTYPAPHYDAEVEICLYDTWANFHDRPNTRVSSCLHERFGLAWDAECGRYQINVSEDARKAVMWAWSTFIPRIDARNRAVAIHYKGDSSPHKKDLSDSQVDAVCDHIHSLNRIPLLMDWRNVSPLGRPGIGSTGNASFSRVWGRDAQMNCAVIQQCEAFVGIDSGPSKCASATDTPTLVTWTGHHPAPFHDPAPNTTHLVPAGYHGLEPVCNDAGVIKWFEEHHKIRQYEDDPVKQIKAWLTETLQ